MMSKRDSTIWRAKNPGTIAILIVMAAVVAAPALTAGTSGARVSAAARAHAQAAPGETIDVIAMHRHSERANMNGIVQGLGGVVTREFVSIPAVAASIPADSLDKFANHPALSFVALDAPVTGFADTSVNGPSTTVNMSAAATYGLTGSGVTVAVLDSGIQSHADLSLVQSVDIIPAHASCGFRGDRVERGVSALYRFEDASGASVRDVSGVGSALDMTVEDPANVTWGANGLSIDSATRLSNSTNTNKIFQACKASNEITVEAWIRPGASSQGGPARIVSLSVDPSNRNFTLGQNGTSYQFRLRTTTNGANGMYTTLSSSSGSVATTRQHVVVTRDASGAAAMYIDGMLVDSAQIGGNLSNWNSAYDLGLGNEFSTGSTTTNRDWVGDLEMVAVYCEAHTAADVKKNFYNGSPHADSCISPSPRQDPWGHGTHVAGIIAGNGTGSGGAYQGLAPAANLVSVRVLDENGQGAASDVIAGVDWVLANKSVLGIDVANLSLGQNIQQSAAVDPLVLAVEALWDAGVVVVCSAGNNGKGGYGTITSPGNSPKVITVGSLTHWGTPDPLDDIVSTFSSRGPTLVDRFVKPDLVTPGNRLAAPASGYSGLETILPQNVMTVPGYAKNYILLSGTSMSAAVVSGAAALMLEQDPTLNPATIKARMMRSAIKTTAGDPFMQGAGMLDVTAALNETGQVTAAPSPMCFKDETTGRIGFENTAISWDGSGWSQAYIWSDALVWSDGLIWSDALVWSDAFIWSDGLIWSDALVWSDAMIWSDALVWSDAMIWSDALVWSDALMWSDGFRSASDLTTD